MYEGSNHLGNVLVTYSDKRLGYCEDDTVYRYRADIRTANDYAAFGAILNDRQWYSTADSGIYRFGFNGMEKDNEAKGQGNSLDFGARIYDSRLGRWLSTDPAFKEFADMSTYIGLGDNPIYLVDKDGEKIVVPDPADRAAVLKMINSKALGLYAFNASGELYQVRATGDASRFSKYYADKLVAAMSDPVTIEIRVDDKIGEPTVGTNSSGGQTIVANETGTHDVDVEDGGGVTYSIPPANGGSDNILVYLSGNDNTSLLDQSGNALEDKPADILAHELVGHAIPKLASVGTDTGNAVDNENKVRAEVKTAGQTGPSPLRAAEPAHVE